MGEVTKQIERKLQSN